MSEARYILVEAEVRYWEDADVDGQSDVDGTAIPLRDGDIWRPTIRLSDGQILNWPEDTEASIHYKVCDQGEYWLLDEDGNRVGKWRGDYVPDKFLCHGDDGFGDYIIFDVEKTGKITDWTEPAINPESWMPPPEQVSD